MNTETFLKLPIVDWDEESPIYSDANNKFYNNILECEQDLDENQNLLSLLLKAMDEFNKSVDGIIISWYPRNKRIRIC